MAKKIIEDLKVNKISKDIYDEYVANGTITPSMIEEQAWLFTDQAFVSEEQVKEWDNKKIPTKVSELENDANYIDLSGVPKNLSYYNNDKNFATMEDLPKNLSELENDIPYAKLTEVPTKVSELANDLDFASNSSVPKNISELNNDVPYAKVSDIPTRLGDLENNVPYAELLDVPTKVSQLENDESYAKTSQIPTKLSELENDDDYAKTSQIPNRISELTNDSKYVKENDDISKLNNDAGYLTTESDPTVPSWAKENTKPTYTKAEVGLGDVENKSSATIRSELTTKNVTDALGFVPLDESTKGIAGGIASLDSNGTIPSSQLPSFVDDVLEFADKTKFPTTGDAGKIYIDCSTNTTYRWSGTRYTSIGADITLGETSSTAYPGDKGKVAYDHAISRHAPVDAQKNIIEAVAVNGVTQEVVNKTVQMTIPTKLSELTNDVGYSEATDIPTKVSQLVNDVPYAKKSELPKNVSELTNDEGFVTSTDIPTKVSELANDVPYAKKNELPKNLSELNNDAGYLIGDSLPTKVSELENDAGYLVAEKLPTKVSELENDAGYLIGDSLPTKVSELENDTGYITADDDIEGNAKTASGLQNTIDISIKDYDETNESDKIPFNGSSNTSLKMPENFKGTLYGNVINRIESSWLDAAKEKATISITDKESADFFNPLYRMKTINGTFIAGIYKRTATTNNVNRSGFNIAYFKQETIDADTNLPDYIWNFNDEGCFNPYGRTNMDIGSPVNKWNKIYSRNNISDLFSTITFGPSSANPEYICFCKMQKNATSGRTQATFLVSGTGDFGGNTPGTYLITVGNRNIVDQPMKISCLQPYNTKGPQFRDIQFGYYSDSEYYYFGAYQDKYSYQRNVICISQDDSTNTMKIGNLYQSSTEPNNWTVVDVSYSVAGADTVPVGTIIPYSGDTLRESYMVCDGRELSRVVYKELFDTIGTTYGSGDGSTTFNIPDLRHRVPVGLDTGNTKFDTLGKEYGEETHKLSISEMPAHTHGGKHGDFGQTSGLRGTLSNTDGEGAAVITGSTGGDQAHNNIQPSLTVNYMIKVAPEVGVLYPIERNASNISDHHLTTSSIVHEIVGAVRDDLLTTLGLKNSTYNSSKTYAVNDLVVYDNKLWACKTAITVAEAWDEAHWIRQSILDIK